MRSYVATLRTLDTWHATARRTCEVMPKLRELTSELLTRGVRTATAHTAAASAAASPPCGYSRESSAALITSTTTAGARCCCCAVLVAAFSRRATQRRD